MKTFFKMVFETIRNVADAIYQISVELPGLTKLSIREVKSWFEDEQAPALPEPDKKS